jgi:hypothetical protein
MRREAVQLVRQAVGAGTCGDITQLGAFEPQTQRSECRHSCPSNGPSHPILIPGSDARKGRELLAHPISVVWQPLGSLS